MKRSLAWRLYAVGVVQLVLLVIVAVAVAMLAGIPERPDPQRLSTELNQLLAEHGSLQPLLDTYHQRRILLSVYGASGELLGSNVRPALALPEWAAGATEAHERRSQLLGHDYDWFGAMPFPSSPSGDVGRSEMQLNAYIALGRTEHKGMLVMRLPRPRFYALPPVLTVLVGLVIILVGAALNTRWLTRPLERLSRAVHSLGRGNFDARAPVDRNDELGEVAKVFNEMAQRVQQLLLAEKELLANVAHELRTPLARIRVATEIASESDFDQMRASLADITLDLSELEVLTDDVLTATRFQLSSGPLPAMFDLCVEETCAQMVAERAAERFRIRHPSRTLILECSQQLPTVEVDRGLFRRVIDNLLENADKYSPEPSTPISLRLFGQEHWVFFEVRDAGSGITSEDLPHIFTPFFRAERSRSRATGGVGLGLTLAKRIVEAHSGGIELTSELGLGTSVRVRLPAASL